METLTQRALTIATERREEAWTRMHKATNEGSRKHWSNSYEKNARLVILLTRRLKGE